jgi:hypothetical protein
VELFQTTGKVQNAEVLFDGGRSKGVGVVQFETVQEAETAIGTLIEDNTKFNQEKQLTDSLFFRTAKFQNYSYGGRPLSLEFNGRWRDFSIAGSGN